VLATFQKLPRRTELPVVSAAASLAYESDQQVAVLISQRMLGRKKWTETK